MFKINNFVRNKHVNHLISKIIKITDTQYFLENGYCHEKDDNCLELWFPKQGEWILDEKYGLLFLQGHFNNKWNVYDCEDNSLKHSSNTEIWITITKEGQVENICNLTNPKPYFGNQI